MHVERERESIYLCLYTHMCIDIYIYIYVYQKMMRSDLPGIWLWLKINAQACFKATWHSKSLLKPAPKPVWRSKLLLKPAPRPMLTLKIGAQTCSEATVALKLAAQACFEAPVGHSAMPVSVTLCFGPLGPVLLWHRAWACTGSH